MNENLTPQIVAALLQDGTVKMTGEEIATAIADAVGALEKQYRFRGVATPGAVPGKIFEPTLYVAVASATYGPFSNQSVDKGQIVLLTSDDGAYWDATIAYCGGNGCDPEPGPGPEPPTPSAKPLTFRALSNGTEISFIFAGPDPDVPVGPATVEISTDGGQTWTEKTASVGGTLLATLQAGDELQLRGTNAAYADGNSGSFNYFSITDPCEASGNIMSLIDAENFVGAELVEGVNDLAFYSMFYGCTGLTQAPELPATTLADNCYSGMFAGCTGLTQAPELPATTLAHNCYNNMFYGCTGLTQAPELPATTLADTCYGGMFYGCTGLTQAPELPAITLADNCYDSMFADCTGLTQAPELPATTLAAGCYSNMFDGCESLAEITCLATDLSAATLDYALDYWLDGVAATGTFAKAAGVEWPEGVSGIPSGWTVVEV